MSEEEEKVHDEEEETTADAEESEDVEDEETGADDEESDEGEDEEESDDDSEDDDSEDDDEEEEEPAPKAEAKPKPRKKKKTGRKKKAPKSTAGQRLAAAKAAKAAKKAAARGKQAEMVEDEAAARADKAAGWLETNRGPLMAAAMALLVIMGGYFAYDAYSKSQSGDASTLLWEATTTLNAPLGDDEDASDDEEEGAEQERYETIDARADAALEKLDAMLADYSGTDLAPWAQLLRGRALYQKGEHEAAREAFSTALSDGGEDVRARALEGIAFTYEADENWDEAVSRFEELRSDDEQSLSILADYHIARVHIAQENEEGAKEKLQAVLDALREEDAPELGYVRDQAELRLMAIDSSLVQRSTPDQDEMRRLIEQLQRQQQAEGG